MIILIKFMGARVVYVAGIGCTRTSPPRPHAFKQYPSHPCYGHDDDYDFSYQFMFVAEYYNCIITMIVHIMSVHVLEVPSFA